MLHKWMPTGLAMLLTLAAIAQEVNVKVMDMATLKPLQNVTIAGRDAVVTDNKGRAKVELHPDEQLMFSNPDYYPMLMKITADRPDDEAVLEIYLVRKSTDTPVLVPGNLKNANTISFEEFEYEFVHDSLPDNAIKVHVWDEVNALTHRRNLSDVNTRYGVLHLGWENPVPYLPQHDTKQDPYQLKKFTESGRKFYLKQ
ncbi:MAG: hypothetical protein MUD08_16655 [Cytophagales bacterium]|jgi:hypothetical protein|nr:hypothetical protein [Cytophagales bacterium]